MPAVTVIEALKPTAPERPRKEAVAAHQDGFAATLDRTIDDAVATHKPPTKARGKPEETDPSAPITSETAPPKTEPGTPTDEPIASLEVDTTDAPVIPLVPAIVLASPVVAVAPTDDPTASAPSSGAIATPILPLAASAIKKLPLPAQPVPTGTQVDDAVTGDAGALIPTLPLPVTAPVTISPVTAAKTASADLTVATSTASSITAADTATPSSSTPAAILPTPVQAIPPGAQAVAPEQSPVAAGAALVSPAAMPMPIPIAPRSPAAGHATLPTDEPIIGEGVQATSTDSGFLTAVASLIVPVAPTTSASAPLATNSIAKTAGGPTKTTLGEFGNTHADTTQPETTLGSGNAPQTAVLGASSTPAQSTAVMAQNALAADGNAMEKAVAQQVSRSLVQHLPSGDRMMVVRLTPPELGTVRIEVIERQGVLTARLHAEDDGVRLALERFLPSMRQELRASDAPIRELTLADQSQFQRSFTDGQGRNSDPHSGQAAHRPRDDEPRFSVDGVRSTPEPLRRTHLSSRINGSSVDALA